VDDSGETSLKREASHGGITCTVERNLPNAFSIDLFGLSGYTFPVGRQRESMFFLDPLEGLFEKAF
jgi:hypothetical protein